MLRCRATVHSHILAYNIGSENQRVKCGWKINEMLIRERMPPRTGRPTAYFLVPAVHVFLRLLIEDSWRPARWGPVYQPEFSVHRRCASAKSRVSATEVPLGNRSGNGRGNVGFFFSEAQESSQSKIKSTGFFFRFWETLTAAVLTFQTKRALREIVLGNDRKSRGGHRQNFNIVRRQRERHPAD